MNDADHVSAATLGNCVLDLAGLDGVSVSREGEALLVTCEQDDGEGVIDAGEVLETVHDHGLTVTGVFADYRSGILRVEVA